MTFQPAVFITAEHPAIIKIAREVCGHQKDPAIMARDLFIWVRDHITYDTWAQFLQPEHNYAHAVLERRNGNCLQKAVTLCALARSRGITARLVCADIDNHDMGEDLRLVLGGTIIPWHGLVEFFLDGQWVKATPTFDREICRKWNMPLVTFDGIHDAMLPSETLSGKPLFEYVTWHGSFDDLPLQEIQKRYTEVYKKHNGGGGPW